jgi:cellulose synthase/poly-beta-1,6-N-acetylglucosamine synthase-like glycosyltransferase
VNWAEAATPFIEGFNYFVLSYFLVLNTTYFVLFLISLTEILRFVRRTFFSDYQQILRSDMTWPISVLVPAWNEERTIVETVRSLLRVRYGEFEVIVVNDGSDDETLSRLVDAFDLVRVDGVMRRSLKTRAMRGIYASMDTPGLVVVDKERGGKPDALNAAINMSRYPLVCSFDADSVIDENALLRVVKPFMEHPDEMLAVGGIVRIANGCRVVKGLIAQIGLPDRPLPVLQVVEYLREFLVGRVSWSELRSVLIISGAFGIYRKDAVIEVGGYSSRTDTEDLDLVLRLHRHARDQGRKYRIVFVPDPVCWTEAPTNIRTLMRQRSRWHRGLIQSLWSQRRMIGNPRYGSVGLFALPYFVLFEMFGPLVETLGYLVIPISWALGLLNTTALLLFVAVAIVYGIILSMAAVLLEELSFRRYPGWMNLVKLLTAGVMEHLGYRQMLTLFKVSAFVDFLFGRREWGRMDRTGFRGADEDPEADPEDADTTEPVESAEESS